MGTDWAKCWALVFVTLLVTGCFSSDEGECKNLCDWKQCGNDGCGGSCGTCGDGFTCYLGECAEDSEVPDPDNPCTAECTGKECGDDGCGSNCGVCTGEDTCVDGTCSSCAPLCEGKQCGDDGCGGSCGTCLDDQGAPNEAYCQADFTCWQCQPLCANKECGADGCGATCGECAAGETCQGGTCVDQKSLAPCPAGEACIEISDAYLGCHENGYIPGDNVTGCHDLTGGCPGNQTCLLTNDEGTESKCVENCGKCGAGTTCGDVTGDGYLGCMDGGYIPAGAPNNCHEGDGCQGNATCFFTNADYTESVCIDNCSACQPGSCPEGEICDGSFCVPEPCTPGSCDGDDVCVGGKCVPDIGPGPGAYAGGLENCDLPPMECQGNNAYCGELIQFDPTEGYGYVDYAENGETLENQYRSWLRRDVVIAVQYAAAKVACLADDWEFGNGGPIGLIDMSEENGDIPGTAVGSPGHPAGTHVDGYDIDIAYYQVNTANNKARPICDHWNGASEAYHCTAPPHKLDPWRQALFIASLYEHPLLRVIGCDGQAGGIIEACIDDLCDNGWISQSACKKQKLTYEEVDMGWGWYLFHHHHIHVSFNQGAYGRGDMCLVPECDEEVLNHYLFKKGLPLSGVKVNQMTLTPVSLVR